jgi:hypothetical protein
MHARVAVLCCILLGGCNFVGATAPGEGPDVEGVVLHLLPDQRALIEASFRAGPYPDTFFVNPGAGVFIREADGSLRRGTKTEIRVGDHLRAWLTGVELRSLPPQYPARIVEVHRPGSH